ncbi:DUF4238 domain-containing protein [Rhizobium leguminosarum bv. viciae]|uniref:DUF4238 domain-containing protein n=1 Tax=Rhizobium leguminosarum TaxID=384 RepID=UPI00103794C4|nr:DUF4238 domain-containing protein [Rhizobium leguminosarum]TBG89387.1 DUF4238 domain-containing protein [Rhizobium leguminosarum]TBZ33445.1 DUF4238 domain-containing protein [Rhizobium leguminosarum bv. viciae]
MNTPKRHHFVPQMLLRRFCDQTGRLWYYNKKAPHIGVASGAPQALFFEKHFYTVEENGVRDTSLETYFSQLEGQANSVIEKMCSAARAGRQPRLSIPEKKVWDLFLYYQWKRTPDSISSKMSYADFEESLAESVTKFEQRFRPLTDEERRRILSETFKKRIRENARVKATGDPGTVIQDVLGSMGIAIAVVCKPNKSFVIGSKTVVKLTSPGETRLGEAGVEVWLPIAHDIAVCAIPQRGRELVMTLADDRLLRSLNAAIYRESTVIAGRSEALIQSLVCAR